MLGKHKHVTVILDGKRLEFRPDRANDISKDASKDARSIDGYLIMDTGELVRTTVGRADIITDDTSV